MKNISFVIDAAESSIIRAPLSTPFRIASGQHDELANVFLRLRSSDGLYGYGEAAVATHITGETIEATLANLQAAAAALRGRSIDAPKVVCREFAPAFAGNHAGLAALEATDHHAATLAMISRERTTLSTALTRIPGITVYPGAANYLLLRLPPNVNGQDLAAGLEQQRILIRPCNTFPGLDHSFIRVAVRTPHENARLLAALMTSIDQHQQRYSP